MTTQEWKFTAKDIASKPDLFLPDTEHAQVVDQQQCSAW